LRRERRVLNVLVGAEGGETIEVVEVREVERMASSASSASSTSSGGRVAVASETVASPVQNYSNIVQNIFQMANGEGGGSDGSDGSDDEDGDEFREGLYLDLGEEHARLWGEVRGCLLRAVSR
jgi:hypothetical protein